MKTIIGISFLLLLLLSGVSSQSPAPSPSSDCFTALFNMSDCLTYVETRSNLTVPDKGCCPELAGMLENTPVCLCQLLGNSSSLGLGVDIDLQRAVKLPPACDIVTPPTTLCSAVGVPIPSKGPASPEVLPTSSPPGNGSGSPSASSSTIIIVVTAIALSSLFRSPLIIA